jgi:hypothetical protein
MNTQTTASPKPTSEEHLSQLLETHRRVTSELYAELRRLLDKEANRTFSRPPQSHIRRVQQLQKAFDGYRQAEAKMELLVTHFGGSQ